MLLRKVPECLVFYIKIIKREDEVNIYFMNNLMILSNNSYI